MAIKYSTLCSFLVLSIIGTSMLTPKLANAQDNAVEPEAQQILRKMSDYLSSLKEFTFQGDITNDAILFSGQKLQNSGTIDVSIRRPNRFYLTRKGNIVDQAFYYDGKTLTLFGKKVNFYASIAALPTIEETLNRAHEEVGLIAPGADIIYQNTYDVLMEDVESGFYSGLSTIQGVECHHLAFRNREVDWQIWIENDDTPLPCKYLITSKWTRGEPQFSVVYFNWNTAAKLKDELFVFTPPEGAEKIDFIPIAVDVATPELTRE